MWEEEIQNMAKKQITTCYIFKYFCWVMFCKV